MHYLTYVIIPATGDVATLVADALAPFNEEAHEDGFWDWYQIGGRWTGHLSGYDPEKDPAHTETCNLCDGTGVRTDAVGEEMGQPQRRLDDDIAREVGRTHGWCNGCDGRGKHVSWPTQWKKHDGDVQPASVVVAREKETLPVTMVVLGSNRAITDKSVMRKALEGAAKNGERVVVVDVHS